MKNIDQLYHYDDVIFLHGLFFIKDSAIKKNERVTQKAFQPLYQYVTFN